ncbi:MAG: hypothetical protein HETSPECPRED_005874 [Heterodermia speciosa]|uniref:SMP-30/Gluconolactonase/LRE-like region domain-containing protein n=1 Tax=Heterodermia speciosa TaxID=116794 RepID=A0A8H3FJF8_9LECA|nr:MAG: hypothetical protein HETSPECPRED_005874 [Heterodermia speciosa]
MLFLFHSLILYLSLTHSLFCAARQYPTTQLYQFPNGTFVENLAVRPDGSILLSFITSPDLYLLHPSSPNPTPHLLHRFTNATSTLGITETSPDTFILAVTTILTAAQGLPGSSSLWRISFPFPKSTSPEITLAARIPAVVTPNGLVTLNRRKILLADSAQGLVFAVDLETGVSTVAIGAEEPLFANRGRPISVNGLKIRGSRLYFTNTALNLLGRVEIDRSTGAARGLAEEVVEALPPGKGYGDLALGGGGVAYVTNAAGNFVERVDVRRRRQVVIAGEVNSTEIAEPTAVALGRGGEEDVLFVTTGGGLLIPVNGGEIVGGQVVAIKLGRRYR